MVYSLLTVGQRNIDADLLPTVPDSMSDRRLIANTVSVRSAFDHIMSKRIVGPAWSAPPRSPQVILGCRSPR